MKLDITFEPKDLEQVVFKQINFALILTYTRSAIAAQKATREYLPLGFVIRNAFTQEGIRTQPAEKTSPSAYVYARTSGAFSIGYMVLHETGGIKRPFGKYLALPRNVGRGKAARGRTQGIIPRENQPKKILQREEYDGKRAFKIDEKTLPRQRHGLPYGIYTDDGGRANHDKASHGLTILYRFEPKVRLKPDFRFQQTAIAAIQKQLPYIFDKALTFALKTAK